ncbi:hypothetical protein [Occultella kanbiaonis]|uniref:hypothetical protein n=1 Tax=Occultella kanbiaonis TaxID=2675754 RepID=UPI0039A5404B
MPRPDDPAGLAGRVDLSRRARAHPGRRHRRRRPSPVPLSPVVARGAGCGEARTDPRDRRATAPARRAARRDIRLDGMPRERALATAFLLLDQGLFRIGGEAYRADNGSFGLATLRKRHVRITTAGVAVFDYVAKSGLRRHVEIDDTDVVDAVRVMRRRRSGGGELLAYREGSPRRGTWRDLSSTDIGAHVKERLGEDASAKDFRTWHGTVLAAVALAQHGERDPGREQDRSVRDAVADVAQRLGTP